MVKEIERAGIPVVQICSVVDIAKAVGTGRILRGFAITCPVGDPNLSVEDEKNLRKKYMEKALCMLQTPANPADVDLV